VYVLGDNRNNSYDSRAWFHARGGGVPFSNLKGMPRFVWLAFDGSGAVDSSRFGIALDEPRLFPGAAALAAPFQECLAERPPRARTEPPPAAH
jgi:signal peptidase I